MIEESNTLETNHSKIKMIVESSRVGLYGVIFIINLASYILQPLFTNFRSMFWFYTLSTIGFGFHALIVHFFDKFFIKERLIFFSFVLDSFLISALVYFSGINQSFLVFLHLVNILLAGMLFQSQGAFVISLFTSIFFSVVSILGPEMKTLNYILFLGLNNIAFFAVALLSGFLSDQLKEVGINLRSVEELNKTILENNPLAIFTFTSSGKILQSNSAFDKVLSKNDQSKLIRTLNFLGGDSNQSVRKELEFTNHNGEKSILSLNLVNFWDSVINEKVKIATLEDLTRLKQLEQQARQNEKMAAIGQLAAGIAHEIRNPLAGISGSIEMLSQNTSSEDDKKLMKIVLREIDRLNNLITEFLDYARPDQPPTDPMELSQLLAEVLESLKLNNKLRADVQSQIEIKEKISIIGKKDKLKQALLNILINAYQAMDSVPQANLSVRLYAENDYANLVIKDSGCGMSEETKKKMFEPFHTTKPKGTGLGLAVTYRILEMHKVQIFVESEPGQGTEFRLLFPLVKN